MQGVYISTNNNKVKIYNTAIEEYIEFESILISIKTDSIVTAIVTNRGKLIEYYVDCQSFKTKDYKLINKEGNNESKEI